MRVPSVNARVEHRYRGVVIVEFTFGSVRRFQYSFTGTSRGLNDMPSLEAAKRHIDRYLDREQMRARFRGPVMRGK